MKDTEIEGDAGSTDEGSGNRRPAAVGFSVIEVMVVLVITGIVLAMALPNFLDHQRRNRTETAAFDLGSHVRLARQKALTRRLPYRVLFNPSSTQYVVQRREGIDNWIDDPAETFVLPHDVSLDLNLGGDLSNLDLVVDPQGTMDIDDVPALIRFQGVKDTLTVSIVRTGKVRITRGT